MSETFNMLPRPFCLTKRGSSSSERYKKKSYVEVARKRLVVGNVSAHSLTHQAILDSERAGGESAGRPLSFCSRHLVKNSTHCAHNVHFDKCRKIICKYVRQSCMEEKKNEFNFKRFLYLRPRN